MQTYAGIELGGTKIVCGLATSNGRVCERVEIETKAPDQTLLAIRTELEALETRNGRFAGLGVGTFGPVRLDPAAADFGCIGLTPKVAWRNCNLYEYLVDWLTVPVYLDIDVTASAYGEVAGNGRLWPKPAIRLLDY